MQRKIKIVIDIAITVLLLALMSYELIGAATHEWLLTEQYPTAKKVVLVMDNLNTHTIASLYATFPPRRTRQLAERLEIHYTPNHGSRLDIAEIELSALGRSVLRKTGSPACRLSAVCLFPGLLPETLLKRALTGISLQMMPEPN